MDTNRIIVKNLIGKDFFEKQKRRQARYKKTFEDLNALIIHYHELQKDNKFLLNETRRAHLALAKRKQQLRDDTRFKKILRGLNEENYLKTIEIFKGKSNE
jgi:hypothetical protein